jgi:hypothetical protein
MLSRVTGFGMGGGYLQIVGDFVCSRQSVRTERAILDLRGAVVGRR